MTQTEEFDALPLLRRRLAWDIIPCSHVELMMSELGLVPSSKEVSDQEHNEAHDRLDQLAPLAPKIEVYLHLASEILHTYLYKVMRNNLGDAEKSYYKAQNEEIARSILLAVLVEMLENKDLTISEQ